MVTVKCLLFNNLSRLLTKQNRQICLTIKYNFEFDVCLNDPLTVSHYEVFFPKMFGYQNISLSQYPPALMFPIIGAMLYYKINSI